jgi:nucleoid-associated protein YgaU
MHSRTISNGGFANEQTVESGLPCGATSSRQYVVKSGQTLTIIAHRVFKRTVGICDIAAANNIKDPNKIFAGE